RRPGLGPAGRHPGRADPVARLGADRHRRRGVRRARRAAAVPGAQHDGRRPHLRLRRRHARRLRQPRRRGRRRAHRGRHRDPGRRVHRGHRVRPEGRRAAGHHPGRPAAAAAGTVRASGGGTGMSEATQVTDRTDAPPQGQARTRRIPVRWVVAGALLAAAIYAPFQLVPFHVFQLAMVLIYAVALLGLNLLVGHAGQISLGHGAFFAIGAYTAAIMMFAGGLPYLTTLPAAAAVAFVLGLLLGVPAMRLRGLYLALVTLAIAIFLVPLLKRFEEVTGGSMGLSLAKPEPPAWSGLAEDQWLYFLALAVALAAFTLAASLLRSRVGRALHAVRDNEIAAEVMGVRLSFYKTLAFAWSAMFAGVAGCFYTWVIG